MTIIYQPEPVFNVYAAIGEGVFLALEQAAVDFISQANKPWVYYLGVAFGGAAAATGIPGAAAILYVVGDTVDLLLFHSKDGSDVKIFLNGIEQAVIDTFIEEEVGEFSSHSVSLAFGITNRIDIVNYPSTNPDKTSAVNWLAVGPVTVNGSGAYALPGRQNMALQTVVYRLRDSETNSPDESVPVYLDSAVTLTDVQAFSNLIAAEIDATTGSQIVGADITLPLTLPGGIKSSPVALYQNERGGLITFSSTGPRAASFRIPAILQTIMSGDAFSLSDTAIAALIARMTTVSTVNAHSVRPHTDQDYLFSAARRGVKSRRKG